MNKSVKAPESMEELRAWLDAAAEEAYRAFASSLLPGVNDLLGVRLPMLRRMAKEIAKTTFAHTLIADKTAQSTAKSFEETMLRGFVIAALPIPFEQRWAHVARFTDEIGNWSVCDSFCISLKDVRENRARAFALLAPYLQSEKEFKARFGAVMLLDHFVCDAYRDAALEALAAVPAQGYYARMGVAWAIQTFHAAYPQETAAFLESGKLDAATTAMASAKISQARGACSQYPKKG